MSSIIQKLNFPDELKLTIFNEHFKYHLKYYELNEILESTTSMKLDISLLLLLCEKILLMTKNISPFI